MPDVYGAQGDNSYGDDLGAGSTLVAKSTGITAGSKDGNGISPKGPISAGNDGSTDPPLGG